MSLPNPMETMLAVAAICETATRAGVVKVDPEFQEDQTEYLPMLAVNGVIDGTLIGYAPEEPPERTGAGAEQVVNLIITRAVSVGATIAGEASHVYFGRAVQELKDLFLIGGANSDLGLASAGVKVRHRGLYAANGALRVDARGQRVHVAPDMLLRIWMSEC